MPECRICRLEDEPEAMVAPCDCSGSMKYVHTACLNAWRNHNMAQSMQCSVCKGEGSPW